MTTDPIDSMSLAAYWSRVSQTFAVQHSTYRMPTLRTILEGEADIYTFGALKDAVGEYLDRDDTPSVEGKWSNATLTDILPYLEDVGVIQRIPKVRTDSDFVSYRIGSVCDWLAEQDLESGSPKYLPEGKPAHTIDYIGSVLSELPAGEHTAESVAGYPDEKISVVPTEASLYTVARQEAEFIDPEVDIAIGNLSSLRDTPYEELLESLDLGTTLPAADGGWQTTNGVHDYAVSGVITGLGHSVNESGLATALRAYMGMLQASAWDIAKATEQGTEHGHLLEGNIAVDAILKKDGNDLPLPRTGFDVRVVDDRVLFGSYTRRKP